MRRLGRNAFTLLELLIVLVLLSFFSLLAAKLFTSAIVVARNSRQTQSMLVRYDSLIHRLRQDMWSAESFSVDGLYGATIDQSGGREVIWRQSDEADLLTRTIRIGDKVLDQEQWIRLGIVLTFEKQGSALIVQRPPTRLDSDVRVSLYSQFMIALENKS